MQAVQERVRVALARLAPGATRMVVAVSGGPDSVALLRLLVENGREPHVAHFDHGLRPESVDDATFVRGLAAALELPFHSDRAEVARIARAKGWNLEDAARRLRYRFLTQVAKRVGAEVVVTGHTLDDAAETVLMDLLRGAAFLDGMAPVRGRVVRPLLEVSRREVLAYLERIGQSYRCDPTNADTTRTRAWLRRDILPDLELRYPQIKATLARHAELQRDVRTHLDMEADRYISADGIVLEPLCRLDAALQRHVLARFLGRTGAAYDRATLERLRAHLNDAAPARLSLAGGITARIAYGRFELIRGATAPLTPIMLRTVQDLPDGLDPRVLGLGDLVYRSRQPGDVIHLAAGRKKVSDLFIDRKIPREDRDGIRLLAVDSRVLWIEGVAQDPDYATDEVDPDVHFMRLALAEAIVARDAGELPVGAVVVCGGEVVATAHNETESRHDPTAHAEVLALRRAAEAQGDWRLADCTLFVTLEPCPMCFGAMLQAHLPRLVYGAENRLAGALGSVADLRAAPWKRGLEARGGVLAKACAAPLTAFFEAKR